MENRPVELRPELMPPDLDEARVARLAALADEIDGAAPGQWERLLEEFNRESGASLQFADFQGIYGAEEHATWVRRLLTQQAVKPAPDVTRAELIEVVRRAMQPDRHPENEAYMAIFDANAPLPAASNLISYPLDYDPPTNTWGGGRPMGEYDPTPEQIVDWALSGRDRWSNPST
jgi:hypothetical protein